MQYKNHKIIFEKICDLPTREGKKNKIKKSFKELVRPTYKDLYTSFRSIILDILIKHI